MYQTEEFYPWFCREDQRRMLNVILLARAKGEIKGKDWSEKIPVKNNLATDHGWTQIEVLKGKYLVSEFTVITLHATSSSVAYPKLK